MPEQQFLTWQEIQLLPAEGTVIWTTPRHEGILRRELPSFPLLLQAPSSNIIRIIAFGGGRFLDEVKLWRINANPKAWLCCIPSLWGSGSEVSAISVGLRSGRKEPLVDPRLRPDARSVFPNISDQIPENLAVWGIGDVWAHTLEAFMSPLATDDLRVDCAKLITTGLIPAGLKSTSKWFEFSAAACRLQEKSGVGLIHALAHLLEPLTGQGHARLCSSFLLPVLRYNLGRSEKLQNLFDTYQLNTDLIKQSAAEVGRHSGVIDAALITAIWDDVVRHPFSRINGSSVRPDSLTSFMEAMKDVHPPRTKPIC